MLRSLSDISRLLKQRGNENTIVLPPFCDSVTLVPQTLRLDISEIYTVFFFEMREEKGNSVSFSPFF